METILGKKVKTKPKNKVVGLTVADIKIYSKAAKLRWLRHCSVGGGIEKID